MNCVNHIDDIVRNLLNMLPRDVISTPADLDRKFYHVLQGAFSKMDFVTREAFDVQTKVLARTREKLEYLEQKLAALESVYPE